MGLLQEIRPPGENSYVGTVSYMPPPPEPPGTVAADIYALGMVLYVISTGRDPCRSLDLETCRVLEPDFMLLNKLICQACAPDLADRFATVLELWQALREVEQALADSALTRRA